MATLLGYDLQLCMVAIVGGVLMCPPWIRPFVETYTNVIMRHRHTRSRVEKYHGRGQGMIFLAGNGLELPEGFGADCKANFMSVGVYGGGVWHWDLSTRGPMCLSAMENMKVLMIVLVAANSPQPGYSMSVSCGYRS